MKDRIAVVVVGAGNVANGMHLPAWRKIPEAKVVALCDSNRERAEIAARKWNIGGIYTDFEDLLEEQKGAIVDICTPPATHMPLSIKAMKEGFNVILEKPMAMSIEESEKILMEHQKRGKEVKLLVVHNYLFSPSMLEIKSVLKKEKVDVINVDVRMLHTRKDEMISDKNHWVHSLPGGRFGECLIHPIYLLQDLLGGLKLRDVYVWKKGEYSWVKYDELYATFNSDNGKAGSIYISFNSPRETSFPMMRIYGRNMLLNFDGSNSTLTIQKHLEPTKLGRVEDSMYVTAQTLYSTLKNIFKVLTNQWKSGHEVLFRCFLKSVMENSEMPYTPEEAFKANKTFLEVLSKLP